MTDRRQTETRFRITDKSTGQVMGGGVWSISRGNRDDYWGIIGDGMIFDEGLWLGALERAHMDPNGWFHWAHLVDNRHYVGFQRIIGAPPDPLFPSKSYEMMVFGPGYFQRHGSRIYTAFEASWHGTAFYSAPRSYEMRIYDSTLI